MPERERSVADCILSILAWEDQMRREAAETEVTDE